VYDKAIYVAQCGAVLKLRINCAWLSCFHQHNWKKQTENM